MNIRTMLSALKVTEEVMKLLNDTEVHIYMYVCQVLYIYHFI